MKFYSSIFKRSLQNLRYKDFITFNKQQFVGQRTAEGVQSTNKVKI